ncbi:hypothetical protein RBSWK_03147 [Rhodopirellula baltica SWK14]|uniref:Uncharacterized protein n=1 Tax=Rhodopirellula baltica SWK14 TaxID=993516 RepID=L7CH28_RHOBT|nr:hypothetical protein RBSWK_03147 [Rhodopirellula baltica SWK14]
MIQADGKQFHVVRVGHCDSDQRSACLDGRLSPHCLKTDKKGLPDHFKER